MANIQVDNLLDPRKLAAVCHTTIIVSSRTSSTSCGRFSRLIEEPRQARLVQPVQPLERVHVMRLDALEQLAFVERARARGFGPGANCRP